MKARYEVSNMGSKDGFAMAATLGTLGTNRPDIRVADGGTFERTYEWKLLPRNLMYERNR